MLATYAFLFFPNLLLSLHRIVTTNVARVVAMRSHIWDKEVVPCETCRRQG